MSFPSCIILGLAGVSCQPHSLGGDQRGMADPRSASLPKALHTSWCLQCPITVLECVPGLLHDKAAQELLRSFCQSTGSCLTQAVLCLSDSWSAKRDRWFAVLSSPVIGPVSIPAMPKRPQFSTVRSVMPFVHSLSPLELQELELTLYELNKFAEFGVGGIQNSYLAMDSVLPTCLHSAGNQLFECKCGCRGPFSLKRLASKGLYGVLIPLSEVIVHCNLELTKCRYFHPREMFLLNGGNPNIVMPGDLRLALSGVGQCVSPLHAIWVLGHVVNAINRLCFVAPLDPEKIFDDYIRKVISARDAMWPSPVTLPVPVPSVSLRDIIMVDHEAGTRVTIQVDGNANFHQLLLAENRLRSDSDKLLHSLFQGGVQCQLSDLIEVSEVSVDVSPVVDTQAVTCPCCEWDEEMDSANLVTPTEIDRPPVEISPTVPFTVVSPRINEPALALLELERLDFLDLVPPKIAQVSSLGFHVRQHIPKANRLRILEKQQELWADDEIRFGMRNLVHEGSPSIGLVSWDPLMLSSIVRYGHLQSLQEYVHQLPQNAVIVSAVVIEQHWYPIVWHKTHNQIFGVTCGHQYHISVALQTLHATVCRSLGLPVTQLIFVSLDFPVTKFCGAMALDFMASQVGECKLPANVDELRERHLALRLAFTKSLAEQCCRPWIWGLGESDWKAQLATLLHTHGVPVDESEARIRMLCDKLGESSLRSAMQSSVPWKEIKWLANAATPVVQIVKPSELQVAVATKAARGVPIGNRSQKRQQAKSHGKGKSMVRRLDPSTLRLDNGIFTCGHNYQLGQLELTQISHNAHGVVICGLQAALPFLKSGKQLSVGGLALIIVDDLDGAVSTSLISERIRFPVTCTANSQPLLVDGVMYQLGALPVTRKHHGEKLELISVSSCVTKIMIFRDLTSENWSQIVAHPLKHIFSKIPVLQRCIHDDCDGQCEAWHATEAFQFSDPILEIWGRQWMKLNFDVSTPDEAAMYAVHIRLPSCVQVQVQTYSGIAGVFLEPKGEDGKQPSSSFQVVWLPRLSFQEVQVLRQTVQGAIGIARLGAKFGLRSLVEQASSVHAAVKPGVSYLPQGRKQQFLVGPVPFGTLKSSLCEMFEAIQWKARPVQATPSTASVDGLMWKVQAVEDPPVMIIPAGHGDMVVTKLHDEKPLRVQKSIAVGTSQTLDLCTSGVKVDPLQVNDPWAVASRFGAPLPSPTIEGDDPIAVLEQKVLASIEAKLPDVATKKDEAVSSRVEVLEQQVKALSEQQTQLHGVVQEQGRQHQHQIAQVQHQGNQLENALKHQNDQLVSFQSKFWAQLEHQQSHLDSLFQDQMGRIEQLINVSKKPRKESPGPSF